MSYYSRLQKAFEGAPRLPLNDCSKYVIFSDCHRGIGNTNDNFLKNQTLYMAALKHYFTKNFSYIELGDGDELWENHDLTKIVAAHSDVYELLSLFHRHGRLYLLYGNHDIVKKNSSFTSRCCSTYPCCCCNNPHLESKPLLPDIKIYEGIILENNAQKAAQTICLTHGHQAELLNSTLWPLARFLVRFLWKPLESIGILNPTSAAQNSARKKKTENRLHHFASENDILLIAGHTHRAFLSEADPYYCNSGSCVHPYKITCLEIEHMHISLVQWSLSADADMHLYVSRKILTGPVALDKLQQLVTLHGN